MPELSAAARAAGGRAFTTDPHHGGPCDCRGDAALLRHRLLPVPDQNRYGSATTEPPVFNTDGTLRREKP